ncbi:MAG: DUF5688 family protein [Lachnospiraceae bacterium]|nr:DUF5688 family protein [Lachnospiraceae bacterium]
MELKDYSLKMKNAMQDYYGNGVTVVINQVTKNNGIILEGMTIQEKENNISPTIYLNSFFETYKNGATFSDNVKTIIQLYEQNKVSDRLNMDFFTKYEKVRGKIVYKLINYEQNQELLKVIPHIRYLDLAIVFYCLVTNEVIGDATILIHEKHRKMWKVSLETLYEAAKENTSKLLPFEIQNMEEVMRKILLDNLRKEYEDTEMCKEEGRENAEEWLNNMVEQMLLESMGEQIKIPMYVLSNQSRIHGAACILYKDVLKNFTHEIGKDCYILPSSIHETLLIPVDENRNTLELNEMVQEVNQTQVDREEVLANHAYYYSRVRDELRIL